MRSPCVRCGTPLWAASTGEGSRVTINFSAEELAQMAVEASGPVRERLLCALGLIDTPLERTVRDEIANAHVVHVDDSIDFLEAHDR